MEDAEKVCEWSLSVKMLMLMLALQRWSPGSKEKTTRDDD